MGTDPWQWEQGCGKGNRALGMDKGPWGREQPLVLQEHPRVTPRPLTWIPGGPGGPGGPGIPVGPRMPSLPYKSHRR